jgi:NRAMP (natural resistance-associated macrophage protein)-like metal ion transporter
MILFTPAVRESPHVEGRRVIVPRRRRLFGPGMLVTAAFVGPGTIATASSAGASFGYSLAWALLFSVFATAVLQEMAVRQALVTRDGLATTLRRALGGHWLGKAAMLLVIAAVGLGNAAYESGNIAGAGLALAGLGGPLPLWCLLIGCIAAGLLFLPGYRYIERLLITLVLLMSAVFVVSALLLRPDWLALLRGLLRPGIPNGSLTTVVALIGTTVVPYNLFLQANAVRERWGPEVPVDTALAAARSDTVLSVGLGGLITLAIISTAASTFFATGLAFSPANLAEQLEPALGSAWRVLFAVGLFAAGLTSAITAPLAAAYAVCGALGWNDQVTGRGFRWIALAVIACGSIVAATGTRPIAAIIFAQAANGLLLPLVGITLLWLMNHAKVLGDRRNRLASNLLGVIVVATTIGLGASRLLSLNVG